jgi:hypothetical protein
MVVGAAILSAGEAFTPVQTFAAAPAQRASVARACSVLSRADVKAGTGLTVSRSSGGAQGPFSTCVFTVKSGLITVLVADESTVKAKSPYSSLSAYWKITTTTSITKVHMSIKGLGDSAVWLPSLGQLWVLKGKVMFSVTAYPVQKNSLAGLENLAKRALKHL